jgi:hypothetical protein
MMVILSQQLCGSFASFVMFRNSPGFALEMATILTGRAASATPYDSSNLDNCRLVEEHDRRMILPDSIRVFARERNQHRIVSKLPSGRNSAVPSAGRVAMLP